MDYREFSAKVKAKYPQYANLDDLDLAQRMVAKYPQYKDVTFDESAAQTTQPAQQPQAAAAPEPKKTNPLKRSLEGWQERTQKRASAIDQPTTLGNMLGAQRGGVLGAAADAVGGLPERAARLGLGAVGSAADLVATPFIAGAGAINDATGGKLEKAATGALQKTGIAPTIGNMAQKYEQYRSSLPASEQANLDAALSGVEGLAEFTGLGAASKVAKLPVKKAAGAVASDMKKAIGNDRGLIKIPDIDSPNYANDLQETSKTAASMPKNMKQINRNIGEPPKKGIRNYSLKEEEQQFLSRPESPNETPFPMVMQQAKAAKKGQLEGVLTPLDIAAAKKGGDALRMISAKKSEIGKIKGDLVTKADEYLTATGQFANATPIQEKFKRLVAERLGGSINAQGKVVDAAGRILNESAQKPLIDKMYKTIDKLRPETTLKELDDVVMDLRNLVDDTKSTQTKQIYNKVDGIGEEIRGEIKNLIDSHITNSVDWGGADQFLGPKGSETLKNSLRDYANIAKIEDRLNRGLGEVVDPVTGQAKMGASLLKSSLMSNSDRGTKALFRAVNDLTGIDLMREAGKAKIAMEAVGDNRIADLLQEAGVIRSALTGDKAGALIKLGQKGFNVYAGEKPDQLLRFYYDQQKKYKRTQSTRSANTKGDAVSLKDIGR